MASPSEWREPKKLVEHEGLYETVAVVGTRPAVISQRGERSNSSSLREVRTLVANVYENGALGAEMLLTDLDSDCDITSRVACQGVVRAGSFADGALWLEKTSLDRDTGTYEVMFEYGKVIR